MRDQIKMEKLWNSLDLTEIRREESFIGIGGVIYAFLLALN